MTVADVDGVKIAGLLFDAGTINSASLLTIGPGIVGDLATPPTRPPCRTCSSASAARCRARRPTSLVVNSNDVIIDDIWAWRADHGSAATGWTVNTAETGLLVNGANVLATGLFVEHYQKYQVLWNGENGKTIFFQNEMPYDVPSQAAWTSGNGNGWAAYKVGASVKTHEGWGLGSYCFFNIGGTNTNINAARAFEVPDVAGREAARPAHRLAGRQRHDQPRRQQHGRHGAGRGDAAGQPGELSVGAGRRSRARRPRYRSPNAVVARAPSRSPRRDSRSCAGRATRFGAGAGTAYKAANAPSSTRTSAAGTPAISATRRKARAAAVTAAIHDRFLFIAAIPGRLRGRDVGRW